MGVSFSRLTNVSLKEQVIRELENKILSGALQPGGRLPPERELAAAMGISRSLLNLCILELESKGFVRIVPRKGTFVNDYKKQGTPQMLISLMHFDSDKMDWTLFDNMMDTRRLLEYECTRLAVRNAGAGDLEQIKKALYAMRKNESIEAFIDGNFNYHYALTSASGNAVYAMIFNSFGHAVRYFLRLFFINNEKRDDSLQHHTMLYEALCERDEAASLAAIELTLDMGIEWLSSVFKR
jgi:GntR family transcriptional repressor for pyruvate dehydrogenase complex